MLEVMCRDVFFRACQKIVDGQEKNRLAVPKWKGRPENEFRDFIRQDDHWVPYDGHIIRKVMDTRITAPIRDAFNYFTHGENLRDTWVRKRYGTMENAMRQTRRFPVLFNEFMTDFDSKRSAFMDKTNELLALKAVELKRQGKMPQSHGGVANLLKVLTATMKQQGSSIKTIAKVQYTVCLQAGIYIPEEFITDVLVAANIEKE